MNENFLRIFTFPKLLFLLLWVGKRMIEIKKILSLYPLKMMTMVFIVFHHSLTIASSEEGIILGTDEWSPYEFILPGINGEKDKVSGFSTEVVQHVLFLMNSPVKEIRVLPWSRAENYLQRGEIDALYSASPSNKRQQYAFYSAEPLVDSPWVFFIHKDQEMELKFQSFEDLLGHKVGVVKDYSYTPEFWNFLRESGQYEIVTHDELNFKKLARKRVEMVVSEIRTGLALVRKLGMEDKIVILKGRPIKVSGLYVIFSKKTMKADFVHRFSEELKKFKNTLRYRKIYQKYF